MKQNAVSRQHIHFRCDGSGLVVAAQVIGTLSINSNERNIKLPARKKGWDQKGNCGTSEHEHAKKQFLHSSAAMILYYPLT
ncbi:hypothetical protein L0156_20825, partial [bacterium]|nr:hypothetical protein [bacterium]